MILARDIIDLFALKNATINGDEIICSCPFPNHANGDRHPSFGINVSKGIYNCFSCRESGTLVQLAMNLLNMSRYEANKTLNPELSMEDIMVLMAKPQQERSESKTYSNNSIGLWADGKRDYWYSRGFNDESIGKWQLGFDEQDQRAVVPIFTDGDLVGWSKRATRENDQPKWKHSENFQKSNYLFGMNNFTGDSVILVEAPLSVIMLDQYGIHNSVSSFGCNLSDRQAILLRNNYNNILIFYDPDEAGRKGTANAIKKLKKFMNVYVVQPTRDDPAAMTEAECHKALEDPVIPGWYWEIMNRR